MSQEITTNTGETTRIAKIDWKKVGKTVLAGAGIFLALSAANRAGVDFIDEGSPGSLTGDTPADVRQGVDKTELLQPGVQEGIKEDRMDAENEDAFQLRQEVGEGQKVSNQDTQQLKDAFKSDAEHNQTPR